MLLFFALCFFGDSWRIEASEMYQPLDSAEVILAESGSVYVLNFKEAHIKLYGPDGEEKKQIGRKGRGPDEFTYPTEFFLTDGKLYVVEVMESVVKVFDAEGDYKETIPLPSRGIRPFKVKGGWVYGNWDNFAGQEEPAVFFSDLKFQNVKTLMSIKEEIYSKGVFVMSDGKGNSKGAYSPIDKKPFIVVEPNGDTFYVSHPENFEIYVYDGGTGERLRTISRDDAKIPFDKDWADERFQQMKMDEANPGVSFQKNYPEFFPAIREIKWTPDGALAVNRWRGNPDDHAHMIVLDRQGEEVEAKLSWEALSRCVGNHGGYYYFTTYDNENDQAGLARCKPDEVSAFLETNPIEYEGSYGRSISISH